MADAQYEFLHKLKCSDLLHCLKIVITGSDSDSESHLATAIRIELNRRSEVPLTMAEAMQMLYLNPDMTLAGLLDNLSQPSSDATPQEPSQEKESN